jgi:hypothetical protein
MRARYASATAPALEERFAAADPAPPGQMINCSTSKTIMIRRSIE